MENRKLKKCSSQVSVSGFGSFPVPITVSGNFPFSLN